MSIGQLSKKLNKRTKIFLSIVLALLILIAFERLSFSPFSHSSVNVNDELSLKKELFAKYNLAISMMDSYSVQLGKLTEDYKTLENRLILCKTKNLAQAKLQDYVKKVARQSGLLVTRSSSQNVEIINDDPHLMLVYARVEIADVDRIVKLQKFLYNIECKNEKLIFIDDIKIKSTGFGTRKGVSSSIKLFAIAKLEAST